MVKFLSNWGQGIIVAVIIGTIIEMLIPAEGGIKKYVKVVIGVYILFSVVSPFIQKIGKVSINNIFNTETYEKMMSSKSNDITKKIEDNNTRTVKDIYIASLKQDIEAKIEGKGYNATDIFIIAADDENYTIEKISLKLNRKKVKEEENKQINSVKINEITIKEKQSKLQKGTIENEELNKIKEYLSKTYDIDEKTIDIS